MDEMEVLAPSLTNDSRQALVSAFRDTIGNSTIKLPEYSGAASVVKSSKFLVGENDLGDFFRVAWNKLNNVLWQTSLQQNIIKKPVRRNRRVGWLPYDNISHQG